MNRDDGCLVLALWLLLAAVAWFAPADQPPDPGTTVVDGALVCTVEATEYPDAGISAMSCELP